MSYLGIFLVMLAAGLLAPRLLRERPAWLQNGVRVIAFAIAALVAASTSWWFVPHEKVGHMAKIMGGSSLPAGRYLAANGENGPQAQILTPGFHFLPFIRVLYDIEDLDPVVVPDDHYGFIVASDGEPLRPDQAFAPAWKEGDEGRMLDAQYFLNHGGKKGPQSSILMPGKYYLNRKLFEVNVVGKATIVPPGQVGVIKSNIYERADAECKPIANPKVSNLSIPLVPKGCRGVWSEVLQPGKYYLNRAVYEVTQVDSRSQVWRYEGGFTPRSINLQVGLDGKVTQVEDLGEPRPQPKEAADSAILLTIEGWKVALELRLMAQVLPEDAPALVATVGTLQEAEDRVVTPVLRSVVRNVTGANDSADTTQGGGQKVLYLQDKREMLEGEVEKALAPTLISYGITLREVKFGQPDIPPELLVARRRQQLAEQMEATFKEEQKAQQQRIAAEKERATADQQAQLVEAEIAVKRAVQFAEAERLKGQGERDRLIEISKGQDAQKAVLGADGALTMAKLNRLLEAAQANPEIVKTPSVLFTGDQANTLGVLGVLGNSNLTQMLREGAAPARK